MLSFIAVFILAIPNIYIQQPRGPYCGPALNPVYIYGVWADVMYYSLGIAPSAILFILNIIIIATMRCNNSFTNEASIGSTEQKKSSKDTYLIVMLLTVTFTLLIMTVPYHVNKAIYDPKRFIKYPWLYTWHMTCILMYYTNSGVNFFLYCLSGSKFRQDFYDLLRGIPCFGHSGNK
jgi:hypothetical protein